MDALRSRGVEILEGDVGAMSLRHPWASLTAARRQRRWLMQHRIDIVHMNEAGWNEDLVAGARLAGIPVVISVHNPVSVQRRNLNFRLAQRIVFVSAAQRDGTGHLERIRDRAAVIHNVVDIDRFASGRSLRAELGIEASDPVICMVGQISHRKGVDVLLDAIALLLPRFPRLVALIAGPDAKHEQEYVSAIRARAKESGFVRHVRLLGSRTDIPDILATSDVFAHPVRAEPFGLVIVEAMAAQRPVVASRVGGIPEIVRSGEDGTLVPVDDPGSLAAGIARLLEQPDRGRAAGRAGQESARRRFGTAAIGPQWMSLYRELRGTA